MNPKSKTALITGGAHRLGKAITLGLAQAGANVVINYNSSAEKAQKTVEEARAFGVDALAVQANISDHEAVEMMVEQAKEKFESVDILVNSASPWNNTPFPTENLDDWHLVINTLINGSFYCANAIAPMMLEKGEGAIINIIDETAFLPKPDFTAHSVGKSALLGLTRQLALELAPKISVNAIAPGPILPPPHYDEEKLAKTASETLFKRWGKREDIANTVLFLVRSNFITGEVITVDGGERYAHMELEKK
ncbi:MAG: SDR family oxidoreductase [Anaerolineae bacterium]|jgi:3-oxoacyl-[acyl-carrier protein] reductase/pteridine reductase|nr:SDR family oxidoreductase [Anaerolineae bacterium]MBT4310311.1 SDR family oxidoreductase [Anaerolineae bacterium]MBT4459835.1 SDR family oxidoreductase [Anaerolineae bacterium]MBT6060685.1 SDR family oxidoreductase [Anaerolineae bacterium]MBT6321213.1 SDR family oxidoreductase [Anaerolineae bacterium]